VPRRVPWVLGLGLALGAAALLLVRLTATAPTRPDVPTVVERMREVARLETLDINVYKKVGYAPEPTATGNVWTDVFLWAKAVLAPSRGRAIVFGTVHVGLDLAGVNANALYLHGGRLDVVLPPLQTHAEVRPAETEVISSNLDSAQTGELLELARVAFEQDARSDAALQARARASAERALRGLLLSLGFREVRFVPSLPSGSGTG
jgi:Protein of unknown function (DUF4230)